MTHLPELDVATTNCSVNLSKPMKHRNFLDKVHFRVSETIQSFIVRPMRKAVYQLRGAHIGARTQVPHVIVTWPHQIKIGDDCVFENHIRLHHAGCLSPGPNIIIGDRNFFGYRCEFTIGSRIEIGNDCQFAAGCKFIDLNHERDAKHLINLQPVYCSPIRIEDDVWFGANVLVLPGVTIGKGAVVGAGAVVTKSIPDKEIWAGVPAKRIGYRS